MARRHARRRGAEPWELESAAVGTMVGPPRGVREPPALDAATTLQLQRTAGNAQVTQLIARSPKDELLDAQYGEEVAENIGTVKSRSTKYWETVQGWFSKEAREEQAKKDAEGPSSIEDATQDATRAAEYTEEALLLAATVTRALGTKQEDPYKTNSLTEAAEHFEGAAKHVGTANKAFSWGVKKLKLYYALRRVTSAATALDKAKTPQEAAKAFDEMFAATGALADFLPGEGPHKAYFEFLAAFDTHGGFFTNMVKNIGLERPAFDQRHDVEGWPSAAPSAWEQVHGR